MLADNTTNNIVYARPLRSSAAAEWLGISERQLLKLARQGIVPAKKAGGIWLFSQKKLAEFAGVDD